MRQTANSVLSQLYSYVYHLSSQTTYGCGRETTLRCFIAYECNFSFVRSRIVFISFAVSEFSDCSRIVLLQELTYLKLEFLKT